MSDPMTESGCRAPVCQQLIELSRWVDEDPVNADRDPEALTWHRTGKVAEEAGEVIEAMIGWTGGNPRKGMCRSAEDVEEELLDVAVAALCAVEHVRRTWGGRPADPLALLAEKVARVHSRALASVRLDSGVTS